MKQKVIHAYGANEAENQIATALGMGWFVHCITVNSETNFWIIILYKQ